MTDTTIRPRPRRASALKRWLLLACLCVGAVLLAPAGALAQEEEIERDGRIEGYAGNVSVENQSTALMWLLFVFLSVIGLVALFKDAKRTHLD